MASSKPKVKIYTCSNVGMDYYFFLNKIILSAGYALEPVYLVEEHVYRTLGKTNGIHKLWLRVQMYFLYPFLVIWKVFQAKPKSIFIVTSNTFYMPILVKWFGYVKKIRVIHLLYDLYPDAMEVAGKTKVNSFLSKVVGWIAKQNQTKTDGSVYLGDFLSLHAQGRWGKTKQSSIIHISTDLNLYTHPFVQDIVNEKIIIHYGGQMGYLHDADCIIACIRKVLKSEIADQVEFNFYISGAQAVFLTQSLNGLPINIKSAIPSSEWRKDIQQFHIGLVSLTPGGAKVCLPSKTYGMMAGGMAILGICPEWSDLAKLIVKNNAGWVVNNSASSFLNYDPQLNLEDADKHADNEAVSDNFLETIKMILSNKDILNEKRKNAFEEVRTKYSQAQLAQEWSQMIELVYNA